MVSQGPSLGLSEDEIDDYVQEIAFVLFIGMPLVSDLSYSVQMFNWSNHLQGVQKR